MAKTTKKAPKVSPGMHMMNGRLMRNSEMQPVKPKKKKGGY